MRCNQLLTNSTGHCTCADLKISDVAIIYKYYAVDRIQRMYFKLYTCRSRDI